MLTLKVANLRQDIQVAQMPRAFPVDTMRVMKVGDEERLGEKVLQPKREMYGTQSEEEKESAATEAKTKEEDAARLFT